MTFIHPYLLGGLLLIGVPILVHLVMRQKPRHLPFPAFRFLIQKHLSNKRKLRLQHLVLLLLRMLVIAGLCLALARPRVFSNRLNVSSDRPIAAVLLFDTSPSMEYASAGQTRLEDAQQRARELLDEMAEDSRVAVFDSGDSGDTGSGEWIPNRDLIRSRINGLHIRPANAALNRQIERAFRLLQQEGEGEEPLPRFLFIFSDRTRECWDAAEAKRIQKPEGVRVVFVDVGVNEPQDLAIDKVEVEPPVVAPGGRMQIRVTVRGTGKDYENQLTCQLDSETDADALKQEVKLARDTAKVIVFDRTAPALPPGPALEIPHQVTVRLGTHDALPVNNSRFATFLIRQARKILTIAEKPGDAYVWKASLRSVEKERPAEAFQGDLRTLDEAEKLKDEELRTYKVVCLFQATRPAAALWQKLATYVKNGGGLVIVPGGEEMLAVREEFNRDASAVDLLPATLESVVKVEGGKPGVRWSSFTSQHPISAFFQKTLRASNPDYGSPQGWPFVYAYWKVQPADKATVIATYAADKKSPALVERGLGKGQVVLFTTPLDTRKLDKRGWHNYWDESSFGIVLVDQVCRYLAGDAVKGELNYPCGPPVQVTLPAGAAPPYILQGPGLAAAETNVKASPEQTTVTVPQAVAPGNYTVLDGQGKVLAAFSLNVRAEESVLERVPVEDLEAVLGKDSVLQVGRTVNLRNALQGLEAPPVELLPWLMMVVLLVLMVESLLANKFYRNPAPFAPVQEEQAVPEPERTAP
jgi:hypothetical protein